VVARRLVEVLQPGMRLKKRSGPRLDEDDARIREMWKLWVLASPLPACQKKRASWMLKLSKGA